MSDNFLKNLENLKYYDDMQMIFNILLKLFVRDGKVVGFHMDNEYCECALKIVYWQYANKILISFADDENDPEVCGNMLDVYNALLEYTKEIAAPGWENEAEYLLAGKCAETVMELNNLKNKKE
jgi:hypothetical protein